MRQKRSGESLREAAIREARSFHIPRDFLRHRRHVEGYAIDPEGSLDADDAVYVERGRTSYRLDVSIADTTCISPHSAIARYAIQQVETRYMGNFAQDNMFPGEISTRCLSLTGGGFKPAITLSAEIDADTGEIKRSHIEQTLIEPKQISYQTMEYVRQHNQEDSDKLSAYFGLMQLLRRKAESERTDTELEKTVQRARHFDQTAPHRTFSRMIGVKMVAEFMIFANHQFAQFLTTSPGLAIFRVHSNEHDPETSSTQFQTRRQRRRSANLRAYYDLMPGEHYGLRITPYTHATSPLRRLADFATMSCLPGLTHNRFEFEPSVMRAIVQRANEHNGVHTEIHEPADGTYA